MKKIAIFNQKGGVGKTTTVVNLGACLAKLEKKVLLIDIDPQGNTSSGIGIDKSALSSTIYDVLINEESMEDCIIPTGVENLDILPASMQLAGAEIEMAAIVNRDTLLKNALKTLTRHYDFVIIDCPPSLGLLSLNALAAVDSVLIPIQCEYYALEGVAQLMNTIKLVKNSLNKSLEIEGVVLSMFDGRTNLSIQVVEEVKKYFKGSVYSTMIPRNVRLAEAPSHGLSILDYDDKSKGAEAYLDLAEEVIERGDW